jgi:SAM-dependent methyltransferase
MPVAEDGMTMSRSGNSPAFDGPYVPPALVDVLEEAGRLGLIGSGPVGPAIAHAGRFAVALRPVQRVVDLGSGGGLPGLVIAARRPELQFVLLDGRGNRTDFLRRAVSRLGWADRVQVLEARAEAAGHDRRWRGQFDAVVARSFGSPSVTAECAAPFLRVGGQLVVSEPPDPSTSRWPAAGLALVGLVRDADSTEGVASFTQRTPAPARFPRRRPTPPIFERAEPRAVEPGCST